MFSNRQKKRIVNEGVRRLMAKPGWNPHVRVKDSGSMATETAAEAIRAGHEAAVYSESDSCPDCRAAREESGDETALCERHMKEAFKMV